MTREHSPRPGVTWQQQPVRTEVVIRDETGEPWTVTPWLDPEPTSPFAPEPVVNRADRRRNKRAGRKRGRA